MKILRLLACVILIIHGGNVFAQSRSNVLVHDLDSRGKPELIICSQNLENYGKYKDAKSRNRGLSLEEYRGKESSLIDRFMKAGCDVIAVQELIAPEGLEGEETLKRLAEAIKKRTNRFFDVVMGTSNDNKMRVGFLVAKDRAKILDSLSYKKVELPKLSEDQKQRYFARGPLEIQISVKPRGESGYKTVTLITFHFKSKSFRGGSDPTGLEHEPYRLEMSEAIRRIVNLRHERAFASGKSILVLLGDRNSHFDSASAKILEGVLTLKHFQETAPCRLSKRGVPLCQAEAALPQRFFSVLTGDPETRLQQGTYRYNNIYSWLDDILLPAESLPFAWTGETTSGNYNSGVVYEPKDASDHALVWVSLNW